jgi:hypothetical protein
VPRAERRIFISYRRSDTQGYAGWLHQILEERYGRSNVFRDANSLDPGQHFPTQIARTIASCTDVFVLIGPSWLEPGPTGAPRLFEPDDWVRLELETALQRGLRVLPLLIGDVAMPTHRALPDGLRAIADRHAFRLRDSHFAEDVRDAVARIDDAAAADVEYLGRERRVREERFASLFDLYNERLEKDLLTVRASPWLRAENLRPHFDALISTLEPDEDVADLALSPWRLVTDSSPDTLRGSLRDLRDASFLGLLALCPRRLIHIPRTRPVSASVVWFRDLVDIKVRTFGTRLTLVFARHNVELDFKPGRRAKEYAAYIEDRLQRR